MNRSFVAFPIDDINKTKSQVLNWIAQFNTFSFLDNHYYNSPHHQYECLVAAGTRDNFYAQAGKAFDQLKEFSQGSNDWLFGHFGFDLKNELEKLSSKHPDHIGFDDIYFFVPAFIIEIGKDHIRIGSCDEDHQKIFEEIQHSKLSDNELNAEKIAIQTRFSRDEYIDTIEKLQDHILYGDCYEINFCQEFFAEKIKLDALSAFRKLERISPMPFSAFYRVNDQFLLCASPERYLKKSGNKIISQPIKGTIHRHLEDSQLDFQFKEILFNSRKDRSENVMVVDLMRNDLSRICEPGTVVVEELYGIYTFPQVHQMISTITGIARPDINWVDMIRQSFPMGSMTGAPKKRVLELIEQYERTKRGLFSGAVGYVNPEKDFDFNVVIRSMLFNQKTGYLSFQVGSGITFYSEAAQEYEECLLKAKAIRQVLE